MQSNQQDENPYERIGVNPFASREEIDSAYSKRMESLDKSKSFTRDVKTMMKNAVTAAHTLLTSHEVDKDGRTPREAYDFQHVPPIDYSALPRSSTGTKRGRPKKVKVEEEEEEAAHEPLKSKKAKLASGDIVDLSVDERCESPERALRNTQASNEAKSPKKLILKVYFYGIRVKGRLVAVPSASGHNAKTCVTKLKKSYEHMSVCEASPMTYDILMSFISEVFKSESLSFPSPEWIPTIMTDLTVFDEGKQVGFDCIPINPGFKRVTGGILSIVVFNEDQLNLSSSSQIIKGSSAVNHSATFAEKLAFAKAKLHKIAELDVRNSEGKSVPLKVDWLARFGFQMHLPFKAKLMAIRLLIDQGCHGISERSLGMDRENPSVDEIGSFVTRILKTRDFPDLPNGMYLKTEAHNHSLFVPKVEEPRGRAKCRFSEHGVEKEGDLTYRELKEIITKGVPVRIQCAKDLPAGRYPLHVTAETWLPLTSLPDLQPNESFYTVLYVDVINNNVVRRTKVDYFFKEIMLPLLDEVDLPYVDDDDA